MERSLWQAETTSTFTVISSLVEKSQKGADGIVRNKKYRRFDEKSALGLAFCRKRGKVMNKGEMRPLGV